MVINKGYSPDHFSQIETVLDNLTRQYFITVDEENADGNIFYTIKQNYNPNCIYLETHVVYKIFIEIFCKRVNMRNINYDFSQHNLSYNHDGDLLKALKYFSDKNNYELTTEMNKYYLKENSIDSISKLVVTLHPNLDGSEWIHLSIDPLSTIFEETYHFLKSLNYQVFHRDDAIGNRASTNVFKLGYIKN